MWIVDTLETFQNYFYKLKDVNRKDKISKILTQKSYLSEELNRLKRYINPHNMKYYEPFQYAVIDGNIGLKTQESMLFKGRNFRSLGKMKRSDIYKLQDKYGRDRIKVISDKMVCY